MTGPPGVGASPVRGETPTGWEMWLGAWEDHLADLHAWTLTPVAEPPTPPVGDTPPGPTPAHLVTRLRRAAALKSQIGDALTDLVVTNRRWAASTTATPAAYGPGPASTRDLPTL